MPGTVVQKTLATFGKAGPADWNRRSVLEQELLMIHSPDIIRIDQKTLVAVNRLLSNDLRQG